jgi:dolichyl-diphosphooligosaccharide--protein glycosyltransferase
MDSPDNNNNHADQSLIDILRDWYHLLAVSLIVVTMFAIRMQSYSSFTRDGEIFFSGNDAWYHFREVIYITENWPSPIPFEYS